MSGMFKFIVGIALMTQTIIAYGVLNIEIIGAGEHQIPFAILPLNGDLPAAQLINGVVRDDLARTGLFRLIDLPVQSAASEPSNLDYAAWKSLGAEAVVKGTAAVTSGRIVVQFRLYDAVKESVMLAQSVDSSDAQYRSIGHRIADLIYEKLTGDPGVFSTRIVYVNRQGSKFSLIVADSDGQNEQIMLSQTEPIISPAWSPDGTKLAYVSFEHGHAVVFSQSLFDNRRKVIADFRGSNSSPAWTPDGSQIAFVIGRNGGSQIYLVSRDGNNPHQITRGDNIDTEPNFSPDGKFLLFTSDRGGNPQVYRMPVSGGEAVRMTFGEGNNYSPRYSPDGKSFVFTHQARGKFFIALQDFKTGQMEVISDGGLEKKPSFSPNGKLIMYANEILGRGILETVSSDGHVKQKMSTQNGDAREPVWGPHL